MNTTTELTFAQLVDAAMSNAAANAAPWTPSYAESEAAMQPVIDKLLAMPEDAAYAFIRNTFRGAGSFDVLAISMFKLQKVTTWNQQFSR